MPTATVRWVSDKQFVGMDANQHAVVLSGDDPPTGMRPSHLLLGGTCDLHIHRPGRDPQKEAHELVLDGDHVNGEQDPEPPWPYRKIQLSFRLSGQGLTDKAVAQAIQLSHDKYCSVAATIKGVAEDKHRISDHFPKAQT